MFSHHMPYHMIVVALHQASESSQLLSLTQLQCLHESARAPFVKAMLQFYPLNTRSQKIFLKSLTQIRAVFPGWNGLARESEVHSLIYGGEREKTADYLRKAYPPNNYDELFHQLRDLMDRAFSYPEVQQQIEISEHDRFHERQTEYAKGCLKTVKPPMSFELIKNDFYEYVVHLERLHKKGASTGYDVLASLLLSIESLRDEDQVAALSTLFRALDDARTAYHALNQQYAAGKDYSCLKGLEERLLDHHHYLRPHELKNEFTDVEKLVMTLTKPFVNEVAVTTGGRATFSTELYERYCHAAGYSLQEQHPYRIYQIKEKNQISFLRNLYCSQKNTAMQIESAGRRFDQIISTLELNALSVSQQQNEVIKFLNERGVLKEIEYQESPILKQVRAPKDPDQILDDMLNHGPFLDRNHLLMLLAIHDPLASLSTMQTVAELGTQLHSQKSTSSEIMINAYEEYLFRTSPQQRYYDFYPTIHAEPEFSRIFDSPMDRVCCPEPILVQWLLTHPDASVFHSINLIQQLISTAVFHGYTEALQILLRTQIIAESFLLYTEVGENLIFLAADQGHLEILKILMNAGTDPTGLNQYGSTALMIAARRGYLEIVHLLLKERIELNQLNIFSQSALMDAIKTGYLEIVVALLKSGANPNLLGSEQTSPLIEAAKKGYREIVKELLKNSIAIDHQDLHGMTALMYCTQYGDQQIAEMLVHAGANVNLQNNCQDTALIFATEHNHIQIFHLLLAAGADPKHTNRNGLSPLCFAASKSHLVILNSLISIGLDLNAKSKNELTAFIQALQKKQLLSVQSLINAGVDVNQKMNGYTPLMIAVQSGDPRIVKILITAHAQFYDECPYHHHPLMIAAHYGNIEMIHTLLLSGVDVNARNSKGTHALMIAAKEGHLNAIKALLKAGAAPEVCNHNGNTALKLAKMFEHTEVIAFLNEIGAQSKSVYDYLKEISWSIFSAQKQSTLAIDLKTQFTEHHHLNWTSFVILFKDAIRHNDTNYATELLRKEPFLGNAYLPEIQGSLLLWALREHAIEIVQLIMLTNIMPCHVISALFYAIEKPELHSVVPVLAREDIVKILLRENVPILEKSVKYGCLEAVEILIDAGFKIHHPDGEGHTALMYAVEQENQKILQVLYRDQKNLPRAISKQSLIRPSCGTSDCELAAIVVLENYTQLQFTSAHSPTSSSRISIKHS